MIYEWDRKDTLKKADENLKNHKVSFDEATSVFTDPFALAFDDPDHSLRRRSVFSDYVSNSGQALHRVAHQRAGMNKVQTGYIGNTLNREHG